MLFRNGLPDGTRPCAHACTCGAMTHIWARERRCRGSEAREIKKKKRLTMEYLINYPKIFKGVLLEIKRFKCLVHRSKEWVLFESRPALYFCNYIFITAHKLYNFGFRIKDTV